MQTGDLATGRGSHSGESGEPSSMHAGGTHESGGEASLGEDAGAASGGGNLASAGQTSAGQAGQGTAEAGAGGAGQLPPAGEACVACGADQCASAVNGCGKNPECAPWLACLNACDSSVCVHACDTRYAEVERVYSGVYACLCGSCQAACELADSCEKRCVDEAALPPTRTQPGTLADTGLYASPSGDTPDAPPLITGQVHLYNPLYPLWADGAGKDRYIYVPACATIDTRDMDHWQFPRVRGCGSTSASKASSSRIG